MPRPSSIDKLPPELKELIGRLRMGGCTLDAIMAQLRKMTPDAPSRSALGRHMLKMDMLGEKMRRSRTVAEALASQLGDKPESNAARLNIELLHSLIMQLFLHDAEPDEDGEIDPEGLAALAGNPEKIMMLAKATHSLVSASKVNEDFIKKVEDRAAAKALKLAAASVDVTAKAEGLSASTTAAIKAGIFGVGTST